MKFINKYTFLNFVKILFVLLCLFALATSCSPDKIKNTGNINNEDYTSLILEPKQYVGWVQDEANQLRKVKTIDEISFSVQYKPVEYIICLEEQKDVISGSLLRQKIDELEGMEYYDLTIALKDGTGEILKYNLASAGQYNERIKYFSFEMQHDIILITDNDTIPCSLYHFERTYDIVPYSKFLLGFSNQNNAEITERTIVFTDNIFNKGIIKFNYTNEEINNIPKLKTNDEI